MRILIIHRLWGVLAALAIGTGSAFCEQVSFARDVMAVLSKAGCNGGGCHGNQNGKGDLKLSLWGERPADDLENLLRNPKHVNREDPAASLILQKPTLQVKHEGERRFELGSPEYQIIHDWISAGAPGIPAESPKGPIGRGVAGVCDPESARALAADPRRGNLLRWRGARCHPLGDL